MSKKQSHKESVAQITEENRRYFEKQDAVASEAAPVPRIQAIEQAVKADIQRLFAQNPITQAARVQSISLIHVSLHEFNGVLAVKINGRVETVNIHVMDDVDGISWRRGQLSTELSQQQEDVKPLIKKQKGGTIWLVVLLIANAGWLIWDIDALAAGRGDVGWNVFNILLKVGGGIWGVILLTKAPSAK